MNIALDVSSDNVITEKLFRRSGAAVLIARGTEVWGDTPAEQLRDPTYGAHRAVAAACGVPFGAYLVIHPTPTVDEAAFFLGYAELVPGRDMDPIIDFELTDGAGLPRSAARAQTCALALEAEGWDPWLYGPYSFLKEAYAAQPGLKAYRVWEAQYPVKITALTSSYLRLRALFRNGVTVGMWQATDTDLVAGHGYDASAILVPVKNLVSKVHA